MGQLPSRKAAGPPAEPLLATAHCRAQIYQSQLHTSSVNSVAWAPYELGLQLAAASSDGSLSVLTYQPDGTWHADKVGAAECKGAVGGAR